MEQLGIRSGGFSLAAARQQKKQAPERQLQATRKQFFFSPLSSVHFTFFILTFALSDYPIRPRQHLGRDRQADLFGGSLLLLRQTRDAQVISLHRVFRPVILWV